MMMIWTPDNCELLKYKANCEAGVYVIGQELYQELCNLEEDLRNDDEYCYDRTAALLKMDFMSNCIRLTKEPFYNKPMVLMDWQKAFIEALYSFKMRSDGSDRFKKALLLLSRKNTKSETCSALATTEFFTGEPGADLVCASNDDNQCAITYDAIDLMRQLIDPRGQDSKRNQRMLLNLATNTKVTKLSQKTKNKEGRNISWAVVDEIHEMRDNTIAKSVEQSQSLKPNPKLIYITTEGFVRDGFLDDLLKTARAIIAGEDDGLAAKRFLPWLYTQDSETEVWQGNRENRLWEKSNPTLGTVKKWDYLEEQVDLARKNKADRIFVLSKDFNIRQNSVQAWLDAADFDYECGYDLSSFSGLPALGAVDLAETTDLCCAMAMVQKPGDDHKYILQHYFMSEGKLENRDDITSGAKYKKWIDAGYMTLCPGNEVDLAMVANWFHELHTKYNIKLWKCGYDQRFATAWISRMEYLGWRKGEDLEMVLQNADTLSNAINYVELELQHRMIQYDNDPVTKWCLSNASLKLDVKGKALIVKSAGSKKIDGAVTLAILYEMYRRYRGEYKQMIGYIEETQKKKQTTP